MSNLINKAKAALSSDKRDDPRSENVGPHSSNIMNKADPRIDSDVDHRNNPTSTYGSNDPHSGGAYAGHTGPGTYQSGSTNAGPHSSNLANKVDPRVDSDVDGRNNPTSTFGSSGTSGGAYTTQTTSGSTNLGPHSSNLANKLDPRVDSDADNRNDPASRTGGYGTQGNYGASGSNPMPGSGTHSSHQQPGAYNTGAPGYGDQTSGLPGQHQHVGGAQQPGAYNTGAPGYGDQSSGLTGHQHPHQHQANQPIGGAHQQQFQQPGAYDTGAPGYGDQTSNISGPGVGSTGYTQPPPQHHQQHEQHHHQQQQAVGQHSLGSSAHQGTTIGGHGDQHGSSATPGSGSANKTAGPHNSNLLNKLDPRVDSDLDGSKTTGQQRTFY